MKTQDLWIQANRALIAKSIGELSYEQVLKPEDGTLRLESGVVYKFSAWKTAWDYLRVDSASVLRNDQPAVDAGQFFIDAKSELAMTEIVLGQFLEEMHSTLFSDMKLLERDVPVEELVKFDGHQVQRVLNGHPKLLLNKGRLGWGPRELSMFSPETAQPFQLQWIAVLKSRAKIGLLEGETLEKAYLESLSREEVDAFKLKLGAKAEAYALLPVHPWQWDHVIRMQFAGAIASNEIVPLGLAGDAYLPQISIRTLSNVTRPERADVKLSLSILNTSAVRGIPSRYIANAPQVAHAIAKICERDSLLENTSILKDIAGISVQHELYEQLPGSPYRYKETLGVIWRESATSKLNQNELAIITGSLFHQDSKGDSLVGAYIEHSGLSTRDWLTKYFDHVVVPLYHLQLKFGLGLVAHGQNIVVRLKNFAPAGVLLKDFQGDLRMSSESSEITGESALSKLDQLPPEYLIHDLLTGHLLTVLRFVSATLKESNSFAESEFYALLSERITLYQRANVRKIDKRTDLLNQNIHRVLLNKVRFKIGYADSSERPLPMLGTDLRNPLSRVSEDVVFNGGQNE